MATVKQKLSASVEFGGRLDPSWTGSVKAMEKGVGMLTSRSKQLATEQRALAKRIKEATDAGKDITTLQHRYDQLTRSIKKAEQSQTALNGKLSRARRLASFTGGLKNGGARVGKGLLQGTGTAARWLGGGLLAGAMGAVASPIMLNRETAKKAGLAQSYGVDMSTFMAWEGLGSQMGLNGENIGDLFEEYKNKVSDNKDDNTKGAIKDAFPVLGIGEGGMKGLSSEQQVAKIFEKLLTLKDSQRAAGIADKIFGGEGNKILTWMRLSGKSYQQLMDEQKRYSLVTKEGAAGAVAGNAAVSNLWAVLTSAAMEISGTLGGELAPNISRLSGELADWLKSGGIQKVKTFIRDDLVPGIVTAGHAISVLGQGLLWLAKKLEIFFPDDYTRKESVLKALAQMGSEDQARVVAKNAGLGDWFEQNIAGNKPLQDSLKKGYTGSQNFLGWVDDDKYQSVLDNTMQSLGEHRGGQVDTLLNGLISPGAASPVPFTERQPGSLTPIADAATSVRHGGAGSVHNEYKPNVTIMITQQPGESGEALANRVGLAFRDPTGAGSAFTDMADPAWGTN